MKTNNNAALKAGAAPFALALALASAPAFAQQAAPQADAATETSEPTAIVVTGSLIRNPNLVQANPVNVTTSEEIQLKQSNTAEEVLRDVPGIVPNLGSAVNNGSTGASYVDLRGLGSNRNVVLLDGQRIVPFGLSGVVDLNSIPLALVDRVDALTGAAVTTYGADAITGVVNFVTKKHFTGMDLTVSDQITQRGDGNYFRGDLTVGSDFADDRGNAVLSLGYQDANPVYQGDRDFSRTAIDSFSGTAGGSGTPTPARISLQDQGTSNSIDPATGKIVKGYIPYNFNPFNLLQTGYKRYNIFAQANYQVSDAIEVYTRALFTKTKILSVLAPGGSFSTNVDIPLSNPFLPDAARLQLCAGNRAANFHGAIAATETTPALAASPLTLDECNAAANANSPSDPNYRTINTTIRRRTPEAGTRDYRFSTTTFDVMFGFRGKITDHLDWDLHGSYGENENSQVISGYLRTSRLKEALLATKTGCVSGNAACVPFNLFGPTGSITPEMVAFLTAPSTTSIKTSLAQVHGQVSGDLGFSSPAASTPISIGVGGEFRSYTASQDADVLSTIPGEFSGTSGSTPIYHGAYKSYEGFAELIAPLVEDKPGFKSLTVEGGVRYSSYSVQGRVTKPNTTTYKAGLSWEPTDGIKFRANYARAVRAPNILELFLPSTTQLTNLSVDPCAGAAPLTNATLKAVCIAQGAPANVIGQISQPSGGQANYYGGGNINLNPEKANTWTGGVVLQPSQVPGLNLSVDYYSIKVNNVIGTPLPGDALSACFNNPDPASAACLAIRRDPKTGGLDGDASTTPGLPLNYSNLGRLDTAGIDLTINYRHTFGAVKWTLGITGNHTLHSRYQATPTSVNRECVGYYSINCSFTGSLQPKWQWSVRNTFSVGGLDASLLWRHLSGFKQEPQSILEGSATEAFHGTLGNDFGSLSGQTVDFRRTPSYNIFDLTTRFKVNDNYAFTFAVQNLFDKGAPLTGYNIGSTTFNSGNTYPSTYDTLGRRFAVSFNVKY
ncbi:TonB-dependent receptor domain-containing protein [Novosphingobium sp.]|uniref:TonB-dependent receptor domain-containing protein n=1 Tax=Novosphingobium sp. TaxID=1874826 RepID=UPI003BAA03B2